MRFVEYKGSMKFDNERRVYKNQIFLGEFIDSGIKVAVVHFNPGEYQNIRSMYNSLYGSAKKFGLPVHVFIRQDEVYLVRTDM